MTYTPTPPTAPASITRASTTPAFLASPTSPPASLRQRHLAPSELEQLFIETGRLREVAVWRFARWATDAPETAAVAVWEQIVAGERDSRAFYAAARRALMRLRRYEERHRRRLVCDEKLGDDPAERVAERVDAERMADLVAVPSPAVREWIDRKAAATGGRRLSSGTKSAGQRWVAKAREQIATVDAVA